MKKYLVILLLLCQQFYLLQAQSDNQSPSSTETIKESTLTEKDRIDTLVKYVRSQYYKRNYDIVIDEGEKAKIIANNISDFKSYYKLTSLVGNSLIAVKDTLAAKSIFDEVIKMAITKKDTSILIGASIDAGNVIILQGDYDKAIATFQKVIPLAQKRKDTIKLYILNYNIAEVLLNQGNAKASIPYVKETLLYVKNLRALPYHAGASLLQGRMLYYTQKLDSAAVFLDRAINQGKESQYLDAVIDGYDYYAKTESALGNYEIAYNLKDSLSKYKGSNYELDKITAIAAVTAQFNVKGYKQELRATNLENQLNLQRADRISNLLLLAIAATIVLLIFFFILIKTHRKRKKLVLILKKKNKDYLSEKQKSDKLSRAKSLFLSNVSHELRTPLYGIIGISSLLLENRRIKEQWEDVKSLKYSADYLLALINDVLSLNKLKEGSKSNLVLTPFNLREEVTGVVNSIDYLRDNNRNTINILIAPDVPKIIEGDRLKLTQVLMNLLSNACKFTENGTIGLNIGVLNNSAEGTRLKFVVSDTGNGISQENLKIIFDEFSHSGESEKFQGTGLGLSIVKKILELHDSEIHTKSALGKGTTMSFAITYLVPQVSSLDENRDLIIDNFDETTALSGLKALIVDDNGINQLVTRKIIEKYGGIAELASDGQQAVEKALHGSYDFILMDINMPVMNGKEATRLIRMDDSLTPIIALTAVDRDEARHLVGEAPFTDILSKPYHEPDFINTIRKSLTNKTSSKLTFS